MQRWTASVGRGVLVFYLPSRHSGGSGNDFSSRTKSVNERASRKSLRRSRERFLGLIIFACMGLIRRLSRRTSKVMSSPLSGQTGRQNRSRPRLRKGSRNDDLLTRRCDFTSVGLKVAKPEISAKDGSPRKRVRPLSVYSEDPELAFVHAAQTRVGANSPLPNGWFLLGR